MNRRRFVSMLFGGAVAVALPERRIFLPPRGGWPRELWPSDFDTARMRVRCFEQYLTPPNAWFPVNNLSAAELTEESVFKAMESIRQMLKDPRMLMAIEPTKLIIRTEWVPSARPS